MQAHRVDSATFLEEQWLQSSGWRDGALQKGMSAVDFCKAQFAADEASASYDEMKCVGGVADDG